MYFSDYSGPYGHIRAHMGPARALEERERFRKITLLCLSNTFFSNIIVFDLLTTLFDGFNVFFRFLAEIRLRTLTKIISKSKFSTPKRANFVPLAPCLELQSAFWVLS